MSSRLFALAAVVFCCALSCGGYVSARDAAVKLRRSGKAEEALAAFMKMAEGKVTDFQKSDALEQAAYCARDLKRHDQAIEIARQIPLEPVSKMAQMAILGRDRKWKEVIAQFGKEDIASWPDSVKAEAYRARGTAAYRVRNAELAVADLTHAVEYTMDRNTKGLVLNGLGDVYRVLLKDDKKAIETYRRVYTESHLYKQCHSAISVSTIFLGQGKPNQALKELDRIGPDKVKGYWQATLLAARARVLAAMGRKPEAVAAYKQAIQVKGIHPSTKKACEMAMEAFVRGDGK